MKDRLYLLRPNFEDGAGGPYFCGECALVEGMLSFFPKLRQTLDVHYVDFKRPRPMIVAELGPDHQSSPVLVLAKPEAGVPPTVTVRNSNGKAFIDDPNAICDYLAATYAVARRHP